MSASAGCTGEFSRNFKMQVMCLLAHQEDRGGGRLLPQTVLRGKKQQQKNEYCATSAKCVGRDFSEGRPIGPVHPSETVRGRKIIGNKRCEVHRRTYKSVILCHFRQILKTLKPSTRCRRRRPRPTRPRRTERRKRNSPYGG